MPIDDSIETDVSSYTSYSVVYSKYKFTNTNTGFDSSSLLGDQISDNIDSVFSPSLGDPTYQNSDTINSDSSPSLGDPKYELSDTINSESESSSASESMSEEDNDGGIFKVFILNSNPDKKMMMLLLPSF